MMKTLWRSVTIVSIALCLPVVADAQPPVGALAVDEGQGEQYGWAVDYEGASAARAAALGECGSGCRVVLTFERCGAYAADQAAGSTAYGWGESYASADGARERALSECRSRGGTSCLVRAWGCNGPVVEEGLGLDRTVRRQIQLGLRAAGYDPGGADGLFGPRTRAAIRNWQTSRGARATGYLDGAAAELLKTAGAPGPSVSATAAQLERPAAGGAQRAGTAGAAATSPPPASEALEALFWQSIMNSTNPAEFEAYLRRFPNGVFSELAEARLASLQSPAGAAAAASGSGVGAGGQPAVVRPGAGTSATFGGPDAAGPAAGGDTAWTPGEVFRDCEDCPEMVVVPAGRFRMGCMSGQGCWNDELPVHEVQVGSFALSKYEVLFEEYDRFADATGRERPDDRGWGRGVRPVINVSWDDATAYAEWLSAQTGATYRLPSEAEWE